MCATLAETMCRHLVSFTDRASVTPPSDQTCCRTDASYNKPYSVHAFLEANTVEEEYIIMVDTDMFFRAPVDPVTLGVRRGNVVSAEYTYLYGTKSGFASRFIPKELHPRLAQVGGFHIFHREDIRVIAPRWLEYTKRVRAFANMHPDEYFNESIQAPPGATPSDLVTLKRQARWHGEMYGYVFAAAEAGVTHRIRRDVMLYPGYEPYLGRAPSIMHYGSDFTLGRAYFNKMSHQQLKLETCPNFLLDDPGLPSLSDLGKKEALSFEHLATLNAAFCRFYAKLGCALPPRCGDGDGRSFEQQIAALQPALEKCEDDHDGCASWASSGECEKNPLFMHAHCAVACSTPIAAPLTSSSPRPAASRTGWAAALRPAPLCAPHCTPAPRRVTLTHAPPPPPPPPPPTHPPPHKIHRELRQAARRPARRRQAERAGRLAARGARASRRAAQESARVREQQRGRGGARQAHRGDRDAQGGALGEA